MPPPKNDHVRIENVAEDRQGPAQPVLRSGRRRRHGLLLAGPHTLHDRFAVQLFAGRAPDSPSTKAVPETQVSRQSMRPHQSICARRAPQRRARAGGCGPISPATPLTPSIILPSTTTPPPQPVPMITPNTTCAPAPAPSVASDRAKQLASLATRRFDPEGGFSQVLVEGLVVQPGRIGAAHQARLGGDGARHAETDIAADFLARLLLRLGHEVAYRLHGGVVLAGVGLSCTRAT